MSLRRLPALARRLPAKLGQVTAAVHALDPATLRNVLADSGVTAPSDAPAFLASLASSAGRLGRSDLRAAGLWLAANPPPPSRQVIAPGDLHPFKLLVDQQRWTLLDWTTALIADPAYDLAFTTLMLRHPSLTALGWLRPAIVMAGAALAWRFRKAYRRPPPSSARPRKSRSPRASDGQATNRQPSAPHRRPSWLVTSGVRGRMG